MVSVKLYTKAYNFKKLNSANHAKCEHTSII
jgi:hypothetical protein